MNLVNGRKEKSGSQGLYSFFLSIYNVCSIIACCNWLIEYTKETIKRWSPQKCIKLTCPKRTELSSLFLTNKLSLLKLACLARIHCLVTNNSQFSFPKSKQNWFQNKTTPVLSLGNKGFQIELLMIQIRISTN